MKVKFKSILTTALILIAVLMIASPTLADVSNGSFETGDFTGWFSDNTGPGAWLVGDTSYNGACASDILITPTDGTFTAIHDMEEPNAAILWTVMSVPTDRTLLNFDLTYLNEADEWGFDGVIDTNSGNQHVRVDVMDAAANPYLMSDILVTAFATGSGSPFSFGPATISTDLSAYAGQDVLLRFTGIDTLDCFPVLVDNIRFTSGGAAIGYQKIEQIRVVTPGVALYQDAGGGVVRDGDGQEMWIPNQTADNPNEDVYDVIAQEDVAGTPWVQIFVGSGDFVWVPVGGPVTIIQ